MSINACDLHRWAVWRREKSTSATNDVDDWTFFFSVLLLLNHSPDIAWKNPLVSISISAPPHLFIYYSRLYEIKGIHTFKPIHHQSSHLISWGSLLFHPQIYTITTTTTYTYNKTVLVLYTTTIRLQHFAVAMCCPADRLKQPQSSKKRVRETWPRLYCN